MYKHSLTMSTYDELRTYFRCLFSRDKEFNIEHEELVELAKTLACIKTGVDPCVLTRIMFLLNGSCDQKHICFSTEAVAFDMIDPCYATDLVASKSSIVKFMQEHDFDEYDPTTDIGHYEFRKESKNKFIQDMRSLSLQVFEYHDVAIDDPYLYGRNVSCELCFVSQETFRLALSRCDRTRSIAECEAIMAQVFAVYMCCKNEANERSSNGSNESEDETDRTADTNHRIELDALHEYYQKQITELKTFIENQSSWHCRIM